MDAKCKCGTGRYCGKHRRYGTEKCNTYLTTYPAVTTRQMKLSAGQQGAGGGKRRMRKIGGE